MADISSNLIQFPHDELDRFFKAMQRAQTDLKRSQESALKWAARTLVGSLAAATAVAKKKRPVRKIRKRTFSVESWKHGYRHTFERHGSNVAEVRQLPEIRISHSGFAKVVWRYMGATFGGSNSASARARAFAARYGSVQIRFGGDNPTIILENRSGYAVDALKGGEGAVASAIGKAATRLEKSIERRIEKNLEKAAS
jgi:hypothetical protein